MTPLTTDAPCTACQSPYRGEMVCVGCIREMIKTALPVTVGGPPLPLRPLGIRCERSPALTDWNVSQLKIIQESKYRGKLRHEDGNEEPPTWLSEGSLMEMGRKEIDYEMRAVRRIKGQGEVDNPRDDATYMVPPLTMYPPRLLTKIQVQNKVSFLLSEDEFVSDKDNYWGPLRLVFRSIALRVNTILGLDRLDHPKILEYITRGLESLIYQDILPHCVRIWPKEHYGGFFACVISAKPGVSAPFNVPRIAGNPDQYKPRFIRSNEAAPSKGYLAFRYWPLRVAPTDTRDAKAWGFWSALASLHGLITEDRDGFAAYKSPHGREGYIWYRESAESQKINLFLFVSDSLDEWAKMEIGKWDRSPAFMQLGVKLFVPLNKNWSGRRCEVDTRVVSGVPPYRPADHATPYLIEMPPYQEIIPNRIFEVSAPEWEDMKEKPARLERYINAPLGGCFIYCKAMNNIVVGVCSYRGIDIHVKKKGKEMKMRDLTGIDE